MQSPCQILQTPDIWPFVSSFKLAFSVYFQTSSFSVGLLELERWPGGEGLGEAYHNQLLNLKVKFALNIIFVRRKIAH